MEVQNQQDARGLTSCQDRQESLDKPAPRKLPKAHYEALSRMAASPSNPLRRLQGGFWVVDPDIDDYQEGWHTSTNAVKVMLQHGLVQHVAKRASEVELTPVGIEALRTNVFTPIAE